MKQNLGILLFLVAAVVSGFAFSQNPPPASDKFERLERDLLDSRTRTEALATELGQTKALLVDVLRYLDQQAQSSRALAVTLDESEQAGFTFGINPDSRHILLRGWREHLASIQKDVPAVGGPKPAPKVNGQNGQNGQGGQNGQTPNGG